MFKTKTVFVVGAGASYEVGLPTGSDLSSKIGGYLDIRYESGFQQRTGSRTIVEALREHAQVSGQRDINHHLQAARTISNAAAQIISIDNYIDAHRDNELVELCGKLGIVEAILEAEKGSKLFADRSQGRAFDHGRLASTWFPEFFKLLTENVSKSDLADLFKNVTFISFNYDRCIEQFLYYALQSYYVMSESEAAKLVSTVSIDHPYGLVGPLPWQVGNAGGVPFGGESYGRDLLDASGKIKTFSEGIEEGVELTAIRRKIQDAQTIVFLGFAFHASNMALLRPILASDTKRVFATAFGISPSDCAVVEADVLSMLQRKKSHVEIQLRKDLKCFDLFKEYWRTLTRG